MFIGEFKYILDQKGRIAIPAKFRRELAKGAVVTKGLDNCLFLYPKHEWKKLADKIAALPISKANMRAFARLMLAGAMGVALDKQGRIILPEYLRRFAHISKNVVVIGLYNRLEIWDEIMWNKYRQSSEKDSSEIAERMGDLTGI